MQRALRHRFKLAIGLGREYRRQRSIPQGDPLPMLSMALVSLPWLRLCDIYGGIPRVLADDML
eukprot:5784472-Alexandrium_andersonii.AAC.1